MNGCLLLKEITLYIFLSSKLVNLKYKITLVTFRYVIMKDEKQMGLIHKTNFMDAENEVRNERRFGLATY